MAYLFLALSVLSGNVKGFCGKRISVYTSEFKSAAFSNLIRMLFCIFIGCFFVLFDGGISQFKPSAALIAASAVSGVSTAAFVIFWLFAVRSGSYMLVDIFLLLGTILSSVLSIAFYGESINAFDIVGFVILLAAVMIMCSYNSELKTKTSAFGFIMLSLAGAANGITLFSQKMFYKETTGFGASVFNFYTFVFAASALVPVFFLSKRSEKSSENIRSLSRRGIIYIALMAACLFLNSFFRTLASEVLDMSALGPLSQGAGLITSAIMSILFFGEKIRPKLVFGVALAIFGLLVMNLL